MQPIPITDIRPLRGGEDEFGTCPGTRGLGDDVLAGKLFGACHDLGPIGRSQAGSRPHLDGREAARSKATCQWGSRSHDTRGVGRGGNVQETLCAAANAYPIDEIRRVNRRAVGPRQIDRQAEKARLALTS